MGDPAGIGLDILIDAVTGSARHEMPALVAIADPEAVRRRAAELGRPLQLTILSAQGSDLAAPSGTLGIVPVHCSRPPQAGQPDSDNAPAILEAIETGAQAICDGRASALLTNPIAKHVLTAAGFRHAGHTEFLGELSMRYWQTASRPVMMLASPELRVVPVTVHIPLAAVPARLTEELIVTTGETTVYALRRDFGIARPRLAVCGLNPHAGEAGTIGREEIETIAPAIAALRARGHSVGGPHSADTLFHGHARRGYDAVLAMYHDQALIPLKTLAFDTGVNVTLGLPYVRTSPDHGTAFEIAGSGKASSASFIAALRLAEAIARRRQGSAA